MTLVRLNIAVMIISLIFCLENVSYILNILCSYRLLLSRISHAEANIADAFMYQVHVIPKHFNTTSVQRGLFRNVEVIYY
jgi:hypothetical protein